MKPEIFRAEQFIPRLRREVFPFFENPENLAKITPPSLGFRILTPGPLEMKKGLTIDYTIKILGLPLLWRTLILEYNPPFSFVDNQERGPYALWHHTHTFEEVSGGTLMKDEVRYAVPFGPLGSLVNAVWVRHDIENIFRYRTRIIAQLYSA